MAHMPAFTIEVVGPMGIRRPILQGWGFKKDARVALKALQKSRPTEVLRLDI